MIPYTPIDISVVLPDEDKLYNYCLTHTFSKTPNVDNGIICFVGCKVELEDWRTIIDMYDGRIYDDETESLLDEQCNTIYEAMNNSEGLGQIYFEPDFKRMFPELVDTILQLPFKYFTGIHLMLAGNRESSVHRDPAALSDSKLQTITLPPDRYNIALNCFENPKFYIETEPGVKVYVKLEKEFPCFAFNNRDYKHGADIRDESSLRRMQLLIYGVLDNEKHTELINRSIDKFTL